MPSALPLRVFLVEDHAWLLETETLLLEMQDGLTVCGSAGSGEEALETLPDAVDVVVADLKLPGMNGLDLVRALAERRPDVACLILSARPAVEVAAAALDAGAVAYVEKGDGTVLVDALLACRRSDE